MCNPVLFRCRFRFRLQKRLQIKENEYRFVIDGREIVLSSMQPDILISDSEWLVINARGFDSADTANAFGRKLKASVELASVYCRLGVDAGVDKPTSALFNSYRQQLELKTGKKIRSNIHGIDVFLDESNVIIFCLEAKGIEHFLPAPFLSTVDELYKNVENASQRVKDIVLLLNYALMQKEPVAQIVFAVSAVEMLGQDTLWSDNQKSLLIKLAEYAKSSDVGTKEERDEIADAITKSIHRQTLRQGVFRLLVSLGLSHLKRNWDQLYTERSKLVHGLAPMPGVDYSDLANRVVNLCGHILLQAIAIEINCTANLADTYYPIT